MRVGPKPKMTGVLRRRDDTETHQRKGRKPCDNRGRCSCKLRSSKDYWPPPEAGRGAQNRCPCHPTSELSEGTNIANTLLSDF